MGYVFNMHLIITIHVHVQLHIHLTNQVPKNESDIQLEQYLFSLPLEDRLEDIYR